MNGEFGNVAVAHVLPQPEPIVPSSPPPSITPPPLPSPPPRKKIQPLTRSEKMVYLGSLGVVTILAMGVLGQSAQLHEASHAMGDLKTKIQQEQRNNQALWGKFQGLNDPGVIEQLARDRGFERAFPKPLL